MGNSNDNVIKINPAKIEDAISLLGNLTSRLGELEVDKDKLQGDSGYVEEAMEGYDRTLTMVIDQLKELILFTQRFLQKANSTFIDTDEKIARGI